MGNEARRRRRPDAVRLWACFASANRFLTIVVVCVGIGTGLLVPLFALATGALVTSVRHGRSAVVPIVVLVGSFLLARVADPVLEESGLALWRRVDEALSQRLVRALVEPAGLTAIESPTVRDRLIQAQGVLTDLTPGQAAYHLGRVLALAAQGAGSLVIVAGYRWWLAVLLAAAYAIAYRVYRGHWAHVTLVLHGRNDRLRHAYYLRVVALDPAAAKEIRAVGFAGWLVEGYRQRWLTEMVDIWRARRE